MLMSDDGFQAECEELSQRVGVLKEDNTALIAEVNRIREECERLVAENTSLKVACAFLFCYTLIHLSAVHWH